ncbi:MAG TPA: ankyrin repeat domain-containing protein, partial [Puia sp.]
MKRKSLLFQKAIIVSFIIAIESLLSFSVSAQQSDVAVGKTEKLFNAIRSGSVEELALQLQNGADVNDTLYSYSALMAATLNGSVEQMKILIDHGANVNFQNTSAITALWLAVPDWDKVMLLLNHGADVNHQIDGYSILAKLAAMPATINIFRLLLDKGADLKKGAPKN